MTTDSSAAGASGRAGDALAGSTTLVDLAPGTFGQAQAGWLGSGAGGTPGQDQVTV
jgi:hypothetical protein